MGVLELGRKQETVIGVAPMERPPAEFGEVFSLSREYHLSNWLTNSRQRLMGVERDKRSKLFKDLTGQTLGPEITGNEDFNVSMKEIADLDSSRPSEAVIAQKKERALIDRFRQNQPERFSNVKTVDQLKDLLIDNYISELKTQDSKRYQGLKNSKEMEVEAQKNANLARERFEKAARASSKFSQVVAGFGGGLAAQAEDPLNIAGMFIGAGAGRSVLKAMLIEAGINIGIETVSQPVLASWQNELGQEYTGWDALENVGLAGIFAGSFTGVLRGTKPSLSFLWQKVAENPRLTSIARSAGEYMSRLSHIEENNPLRAVRGALKTVEDGRHADSLKITTEKMNKRETVGAGDLPIKQREFDAIDTDVKPGQTELEKTRFERIKEFQSDPDQKVVSSKTAKNPEYTMDNLPEQLLNKAEQGTKKSIPLKDLAAEEVEMLKSAGINPLKDGSFSKSRLLKELKKRRGEGRIAGVPADNREHIADFREAKNKIDEQVITQPENIKPRTLVDELLLDETPKDPKIQDELLEANLKPEIIRAEAENFDRLVAENPDLEVVIDGQTRKLNELVDEFADDESFVREISNCAVGGGK